jgi:putative transposase
MGKRKDSQQIQRLLRDADRDLAKGLTVTDVCGKHGISGNTYYRWRQFFDPAQVDDARRVRELESEVERLKRLVAELLLDKQMLQDVAKKSGDGQPTTRGRRLPGGDLPGFATAGQPGFGPGAFDVALSPPAA